MSRKRNRWLAVLAGVVGLAGAGAAVRAGDHCPPPFVHCQESPPCIIFKPVCPRPVCDPCNLEHWGYYPTCWRRWPGNLANCPHRSPPWIYGAPDYQIAEMAPNAPGQMQPVQPGPGLTEPMPPGPMMQPGVEDAPPPRLSPPQGPEQGQPRYEGATPMSMMRPKLSLYTGPHGN